MCRIHFVRLFAKEIPPDPPVCFMVYHFFTCWNDNENSGIPVYPFSATPTRKKQFLKGCSDLNSGDLSCFEFLDEPTRYLHGGCYTRIKLFFNRIWWLMVIMISIYFQVYVSMDDTFPGLVLFLRSLGVSQQSLGGNLPHCSSWEVLILYPDTVTTEATLPGAMCW